MITQINKIKNLGVFKDYTVNNALPGFVKFNLVYGWNGSGKTTLSELFTVLKGGVLEDHPDLEYKFTSNGVVYSNNKPYEKNIRVFNQNYISENIDTVSGSAKSIFILGKENKELAEIIRQDEKILNGDPETENNIGKINELNLKIEELSAKEKEKNKQFTDVARIISANTSGVSARNYNKNNAENAFGKLGSKQILSNEDRDEYSLTLKQQQKDLHPVINDAVTENIDEIITDSRLLLKKTVETTVIKRLKENSDISKWVEDGLNLHETKKLENCEFCNQPLPKSRISDLLSYFNDADKKLKRNIDILLDKIRVIYSSVDKLLILDKANLYNEFQKKYSISVDEIKLHKTALLKNIEKLGKTVKNKKQCTTESLTLSSDIDTQSFISSIVKANSFIVSCNEKTKNFTAAKETAKIKLENHYLSEIYDDIKKIELKIKKLKLDINHLTDGDPENSGDDGIQVIKARIIENKNKMSVSGTACKEINSQLKTFLGRDDLSFEVAKEGYVIKRKEKIAKNLCESEKTAIAFVYFTIHLKDQNFDIKNGIIVIDDPISSLDSNSLFQAFSFLKNSVKGAAQVFILTHNFDFLKLLLGWLNRTSNEYYMIKNHYDGSNNRVATLDSLDKLLRNYDTEYQYLFKLLSDFKADGTIASVYHIPNIARKALEYFLMIMVPNRENMFEKMEKLKFDENKKTAIYKFTNNLSHMTGSGFNPSLVPECQNNVKYLLEMIEKVFPEHYKILKECAS